MTLSSNPSPPPWLSAQPAIFWSPGPDAAPLPDPAFQPPAALEQLGPPPFPRSGFPFIGFLATVYDHVAAQATQTEPRG